MDILILHGWGLSSVNYKKLAISLNTKKYRVYCPDLPGFGTAKIPEKPYDLDDYVNFIKQYVTKEKLGKFILIGHSFGGRIALRFAEFYPEKITKLILAGVPGVRTSLNKVYLFLIMSKIGRFFLYFPIFRPLLSITRKIVYKIIGTHDYERTDGVMRETFKKVVKFDLVSTMMKIKVKTLLVWGEKDSIVPVWIGEKMSKNIINSKLAIVPNTSHNLPYKQPKQFIQYSNL